MSGARYYYLARHVWDEELQCWILPDPEGGRVVGSVDLSPADTHGLVFASTDVPYGKDQFNYDLSADGKRLDEFTTSPAFRGMWEEALGVTKTPTGTLLDLLWAHLTDYADPDGELQCKPLMPTHQRQLILTLGGHSRIRQRAFDGVNDPHWPQVCAVHSRDYPAILADAQRPQAAGKPGADINQKWLGSLAQQYRVPLEEIGKLIIPKGYEQVAAKKPTTTLSDNFTRDDGAIGSPWEVMNGIAWQIISNQAAPSQNGVESTRYGSNLSSANHEATWVAPSGTLARGVFRCSTTAFTCYVAHDAYIAPNRIVRINKIVAGSETELARNEDDGATGTTRIGGATGSLIYVQHGAAYIEVTDTSITGNLQSGLHAPFQTGARYTSFSCEDLAAGSPHYYYLQQQAALS